MDLDQPAQSFTQLPQLFGCSVVPGLSVDVPHGAVGEVSAAEALDAVLESTVQRGLGALLRVLEEDGGEGLEQSFEHLARVAAELGIDGS